MSCLMMTNQAHATLANTLEFILNGGFNRFGFEAPESLFKALDDCKDSAGFYNEEKIFRRLYDLNARAYNGRYKGAAHIAPADFATDFPSVPPLVQARQYENFHEKLLPWHYKLAKLVDCLIYQAEEDATRNDPLFLALIDFKRMYCSFLVTNSDEYNAAPWGSI